MSATIRVGEVEATCTNYRWTSSDQGLADMLNDTLDPDGPTGFDPNPDLNAARRALEVLGMGELVSYDEGDFDPDAIY